MPYNIINNAIKVTTSIFDYLAAGIRSVKNSFWSVVTSIKSWLYGYNTKPVNTSSKSATASQRTEKEELRNLINAKNTNEDLLNKFIQQPHVKKRINQDRFFFKEILEHAQLYKYGTIIEYLIDSIVLPKLKHNQNTENFDDIIIYTPSLEAAVCTEATKSLEKLLLIPRMCQLVSNSLLNVSLNIGNMQIIKLLFNIENIEEKINYEVLENITRTKNILLAEKIFSIKKIENEINLDSRILENLLNTVAKYNSIDIFNLFIKKFPVIRINETHVIKSAEFGSAEVLRKFLEIINLNIHADHLFLALTKAAANGFNEPVNILLAQKNVLNKLNTQANFQDHMEYFESVLPKLKDGEDNPLIISCKERLFKGILINQNINFSIFVLINAAFNGRDTIVNNLLKIDSIKECAQKNRTLLLITAREYLPIVNLIINEFFKKDEYSDLFDNINNLHFIQTNQKEQQLYLRNIMNLLMAKSQGIINFNTKKHSLDAELIPSNEWLDEQLSNKQLSNKQLSNKQLSNKQLSNKQLSNKQLSNIEKTTINELPPGVLSIIMSFIYGEEVFDYHKSYLNETANLSFASNILAISTRTQFKTFNVFLGFLYARAEHLKNDPKAIRNGDCAIKKELIEPDDDITCLTQENEKSIGAP